MMSGAAPYSSVENLSIYLHEDSYWAWLHQSEYTYIWMIDSTHVEQILEIIKILAYSKLYLFLSQF